MKRLVIIFVCLITSCSTIRQIYNENMNNDLHKETINKEAAKDLNCAENKLILTVLEISDEGEYKKVSVEGCGNKCIYKLVPPDKWVKE